MLPKLLGCLAQFKHGSSWSSLRSPAPQVQEPQGSASVDVVDTWAASLPNDLILEIFLRLEPAAVIHCAGVCKPWRRAIIGNASILGPHIDRFHGPSLLLGVFHYDTTLACLRRTPGPFQYALPSSNHGGGDETPVNSLIPATMFAVDPVLLSSKDGFILLTARSIDSLCLCNPVTGYCTIVPAAAAKHCKYILLTAGSSSDEDPAVRILAVHRRGQISIMFLDEETLAYQLLSTSGDRAWVWSPVVHCSGDHLKPGRGLYMRMDRQSTAVGRDTISIDKCNLPPRNSDISRSTYLSTFCPRSRCVVVLWSDQELLIDIDGSASSARIRRIGKQKGYHCNCCPYEMDSSTYISKMKHF